MTKLSVVIPFNESPTVLYYYLPKIIDAALSIDNLEIILIDASNNIEVEAYCHSIEVRYFASEIAMRAIQLNHGANHASSPHLFFLHIDSIPPKGFDHQIGVAIEGGANSGCFQMSFNPNSRFLSFFSFFTQFHWRIARGGDQGLFVKMTVFDMVGKYDESLVIMEDMAICQKLEDFGGFEILQGPIVTSSRKYQTFGQWRLQTIYICVTVLFWLGLSNPKLVKVYHRLLGE